MDGEKQLNRAEEDWASVEVALKQFESSLGIKSLSGSDVDKWLTMTQAMLNKLSEEDCAEGAYLLSQEATFIQFQLNVLQSKMDWCKRRIDKIIAPIIKTELQRYMDNALKRSLAVSSNDTAEQLQKIYDETSSYHARLAYLPTGLRAQADKLSKYQEVKRGQNYA